LTKKSIGRESLIKTGWTKETQRKPGVRKGDHQHILNRVVSSRKKKERAYRTRKKVPPGRPRILGPRQKKGKAPRPELLWRGSEHCKMVRQWRENFQTRQIIILDEVEYESGVLWFQFKKDSQPSCLPAPTKTSSEKKRLTGFTCLPRSLLSPLYRVELGLQVSWQSLQDSVQTLHFLKA